MATVFNKVTRLRIQQEDDGSVAILAAPEKGDPDEEDVLQAIEIIASKIDSEFRARRIYRNTPKTTDQRIDGLILP